MEPLREPKDVRDHKIEVFLAFPANRERQEVT